MKVTVLQVPSLTKEAFSTDINLILKQTATQPTKESLKYSIDGVRNKKRRIIRKMRVLSQQLREAQIYDTHKLDEYIALNDELRRVRIYDVELTHLRNIL
jgi:hypothetical protein